MQKSSVWLAAASAPFVHYSETFPTTSILARPSNVRLNLCVTVNPVTGRRNPLVNLAHALGAPAPQLALFFVSAVLCHGGCVWAGFGLAGFPSFPVFLPRTQLPPNPVGRIVAAPTKTWSLMHAYLKSKQDPRIRSPPSFLDDPQLFHRQPIPLRLRPIGGTP